MCAETTGIHRLGTDAASADLQGALIAAILSTGAGANYATSGNDAKVNGYMVREPHCLDAAASLTMPADVLAVQRLRSLGGQICRQHVVPDWLHLHWCVISRLRSLRV